MRNLQLGRVNCYKDATDVFKDCEFFQKDESTGIIYVAKPSCVISWDPSAGQTDLIPWEVERGGSPLVDFQLLFDTDELCAVLANGTILLIGISTKAVSEGGFVGFDCTAAAWSPDLSVFAVADSNLVVFYDRMFSPVGEQDLNNQEHGKDELVTVGWGSKETQFQGSAGKAAREKKADESRAAYADDSHRTSIKWRADAQFVFVSHYMEEADERRVTVFNQEGELMSRLKAERSMEENVAVRPVGNYVATTTRNQDGSRQLIFFERNGEKRHETAVPCQSGRSLIGLDWDMEASVLALLYRSDDHDYLELWTVSNYDWTRKWALTIAGGVQSWSWSSEEARVLSVVSSHGVFMNLSFELEYCAPLAKAVVVATDHIRFTDLARAPVPPPLCDYRIPVPSSDVHCYAFDGYRLALLDSTLQQLTIYSDVSSSDENAPVSVPVNQADWLCASRMAWIGPDRLAILVDGNRVVAVDSTTGDVTPLPSLPTSSPLIYIGSTPSSTASLIASSSDGAFYRHSDSLGWSQSHRLQPSRYSNVLMVQDRCLALSSSHTLSLDGCQVADSVTSFLVSANICLYITLQNKLHIVELDDGFKKLADERAVELGSRLVCCAPEGTSVVMQMPRGNLETIHPRPFVVRVLRSLIDDGKYIRALRMMKKHRVDMNLLVDHCPEKLLGNITQLLTADSDPDLVNLFIASLNEQKSEWCTGSDVIANKVDTVTSLLCDAVLSLPLSDRLRFFTVLLSALLKSTPPQVEKALKYIKQHTDEMPLSDRDASSRHWLHHVGFFIDEKRMFNAALATYDLRLTVQVAEASNRDPKEYIPLLNELRKVEPEAYRCHKIEVLREDWVGALTHLATLDDKFDESVEFIALKSLHAHALRIYKGTSKYKDICLVVAHYYETKAQWQEASILYNKCGDTDKLLRCLEMSRDVSLYVSTARRLGVSSSVIGPALLRVSAHLKTAGRWLEVAEALRIADSPLSQVADALCKAAAWTDAVSEVENSKEGLYLKNDEDTNRLTKDAEQVRGAAVERAERFLGEVSTRRAQIAQYAKRLETVRGMKEKRIANLKEGLETGRDLEDIDAFSDVASTASMLSRRTGRSGSSRASTTATIRRRKQIDRKKQSLKEGGEYEDSALLLALHEHFKWIATTIGESRSLLRALVRLDELSLAARVQDELSTVAAESQSMRSQIWPTKLQPKHLCGPLHAIYSIDEVFTFPEDGGMPASIVIETEMIPPPPLEDHTWKLQMLN